MMKWMGWLLSDHSAYMENAQQSEQPQNIRPKMSIESINKSLNTAWKNANPVKIQLAIIDSANQTEEFSGVIAGYLNDRIFLQQKNGDLKSIRTSTIANVQIKKAEKWWLNGNPVR